MPGLDPGIRFLCNGLDGWIAGSDLPRPPSRGPAKTVGRANFSERNPT